MNKRIIGSVPAASSVLSGVVSARQLTCLRSELSAVHARGRCFDVFPCVDIRVNSKSGVFTVQGTRIHLPLDENLAGDLLLKILQILKGAGILNRTAVH